MNIISLLIATACAVLIFIVGSYERIYRMPTWFANPPHSFGLIAPQTKKSTIFWIPVQLLFIVALIIAIVTNWQSADVRSYLILALICFLAVAALTGAYFVKEILIFSKIPATTPLTAELQLRAQQWLRWTTIRNVLQVVSLGLLVTALIKS
jgi:uncharacterized membrane protein